MDEKSKKIEVVPAADGKKPVFSGSGGVIHGRIREKMREILFSSGDFPDLDHASREALQELRGEFSCFPVKSPETDRPLWRSESGTIDLYPFAGTKVNRALAFLLGRSGLRFFTDENSGALEGDEVAYDTFLECWSLLENELPRVDEYVAQLLAENPGTMGFSKWGHLLPAKYQIRLLQARYFDFDGAQRFIANTVWRVNEG